MGAMVVSDQRQAVPAIINRQSDGRTLTLWAQKGGEKTNSSIFAQTESGASALVSEACTQMEQISLSESFVSSADLQKEVPEVSIGKYVQFLSNVKLDLKMPELTVQNIEDMKEKVYWEWDMVDESWQTGKFSGAEMERLNDMFNNLASTLQREQMKIYTKTTE